MFKGSKYNLVYFVGGLLLGFLCHSSLNGLINNINRIITYNRDSRILSLPEDNPLWTADQNKDQKVIKMTATKNIEAISSVRIVCFVLTMPSNHRTKARAVKETWGKRCTQLVFVSSEYDEFLSPMTVAGEVGREYLWQRSKKGFQYLHDNYLHTGDWFLKADDDTYVVMENLQLMLNQQNSSEAVWFGRRSRLYSPKGYMGGGSGYILSRKALVKLVGEGLSSPQYEESCRQKESGGDEDVNMGQCMQAIDVTYGESRDSKGRERFFPLVPEDHIIPGVVTDDHWLWGWNYHPFSVGLDCCSNVAVSFHYVPPGMMYEMEYLLYHLSPFKYLLSDGYGKETFKSYQRR